VLNSKDCLVVHPGNDDKVNYSSTNKKIVAESPKGGPLERGYLLIAVPNSFSND
jgi:hypothetical protein